ncbi:hybrid sensor histidine kinase/response regulator [Desulfobulbus alkaliphilus]|uniref:hybrid sensor histidine kinase/response regulator n=1 Tax=Desulfobulbus alkaliphilus TaxID=869814 RepID=UPI001964689C|nr:response regulator [Desulfobulbus alkaliphilus]MBM9537527.1 response regulator [Desulfobulbus alkaliphilus]
MMKSNSPLLTVGGKIFSGYCVLCLLLAGVVFLAFWRMAEISDSFTVYTRNLSNEMRLARDITTRTMAVRLSAHSFMDTRAQASLNQFHSEMVLLQELVTQACDIVNDPDRRHLVTELTELIDAYAHGFHEVVALIEARQDSEFRDLNVLKFRMENLLGSIRTAITSFENVSAFLLLGNTQEAFQRMLMYSTRYLQQGDERDVVLFDHALAEALAAIDGLVTIVNDPRHLQQIDLVRSSMREFKVVMVEQHRNFQRQHHLVRHTLRGLERETAEAVERIVEAIAGQVIDREQSTSRFLERVGHEILGSLLVIFFLALALSLIVSRGIATALNKVMLTSRHIAEVDLRALSDNFRRLSIGDLRADLTITAEPLRIRRTDEVGRMAEAFDNMIWRLRESERSFAAMIAYLQGKARTATDVALGDLDRDVASASSNDVLGIALGDMVTRLRASQAEVRQHQEHLAELVAVRTSELEENRRFLANLLANLPGMAFRCQFDPTWTMEFVSQGCVELTGYQPEDFLHNQRLSFSDVIHPRYRQQLRDAWQEALSLRQPFQHEYPLITASGQEKWVFEQGIGVFEDDELLALEGLIIDVSDRKRLENQRLEMERQLLHTQKLESLGVLAGGIAHDFNNLLAAMLGNIELVMVLTPEDAPWRQRLQQAEKAARQAAGLTRQMLDYSGKGHFVITAVDLNQLVRDNVDIFRTSIARTISLTLQLTEPLPSISGDEGQLRQVVMNLITNASEAMENRPGGVLTLSTGVVYCDADYLRQTLIEPGPDPGWFVWLEVADQGEGMDTETLQRLFDPFFTTKFTGRGLGLAAVQGILRGHGGGIMVTSSLGQGATFRVLFPVSEDLVTGEREPIQLVEAASTTETVPWRTALQPAQGSLILVVDDEDMVRDFCVEVLRHMGYETLEAVDGVEAVRLFRARARDIACVFLDLMMPNLDGMATFTELQRIRPGVPVILCSGFSSQEATARFHGPKPDGFLQKPYNLRQLQEELERIFTYKY